MPIAYEEALRSQARNRARSRAASEGIPFDQAEREELAELDRQLVPVQFAVYGFAAAIAVASLLLWFVDWPNLPAQGFIARGFCGLLFISFNGSAGFFLFLLRSRFARIYGIAEISVGLTTSLLPMSQMLYSTKGNTLALIIFAELSSLYVIVRGLDNFFKGLKDDSKMKSLLSRLMHSKPN